jgi:hypothetical protein
MYVTYVQVFVTLESKLADVLPTARLKAKQRIQFALN